MFSGVCVCCDGVVNVVVFFVVVVCCDGFVMCDVWCDDEIVC